MGYVARRSVLPMKRASGYYNHVLSLHRGKKAETEKEQKADTKPVTMVKTAGCVLHFTGVGESKSREDIRDELQLFGSVAYVDFHIGQTEVRL